MFDIRRMRDGSIPSIEILLLALTSRLFTLRHYRLFLGIEIAPEKHTFKCIRVLIFILPFLPEADHLEVKKDTFFKTEEEEVGKGADSEAGSAGRWVTGEEEPRPEDGERFEKLRALVEEIGPLAHILPSKGVKWVTYITTCPDR